MVGFLLSYTDVLGTLQENGFDIKPPEGSTGWEKREWVMLRRAGEVALSVSVMTSLGIGGGNLDEGTVAMYFWFAFTIASMAVIQLVIDTLLWFACPPGSALMTRVGLKWYDLFHDVIVFECLFYITLIFLGVIVEFTDSGSAITFAVSLDLDEEIKTLLGSNAALVTAICLGALTGGLLLSGIWITTEHVKQLYGQRAEKSNVESAGSADSARSADVEMQPACETEGDSLGPTASSGKAAEQPGGFGAMTSKDLETVAITTETLNANCMAVLWVTVLAALGLFLKTVQALVSDKTSWKYLLVSLATRMFQCFATMYIAGIASSLESTAAIFTVQLMVAVASCISLISGLFMLWAAVKILLKLFRVQLCVTSQSAWNKVFGYVGFSYDALFLNITNLTSAFGWAVASTLCLVDWSCSELTEIAGLIFTVSFSFYLTAMQSWNALQEAIEEGPASPQGEKDVANTGNAKQAKE